MNKGSNAPIIIKKVKKVSGGAHHGGAWKVAYADFVTAMMAFFLLLWLLNVTTDIQKRGIADYFEPTTASKSQSGAGGVLGGLTMGQPGAQDLPASMPSFNINLPALRQPDDGDEGNENGAPSKSDKQEVGAGALDKDQTGPDQNAAENKPNTAENKLLTQENEAELQKRLADREQKKFAAAEFALRQAIQDVPDLKNLADNLIIDQTPEGLRIQIVDQEKLSMFPVGSADMEDSAKKLLGLVALVVERLPNKITIAGHTDARPYAAAGNYGNWELSADRANASRRQLTMDGLPPERIKKVEGLAEQDPMVPDDPLSPRNRRISIVLLREAKDLPAGAKTPGADPKPPAAADGPAPPQ
jgi:chemotaxis protein MotB